MKHQQQLHSFIVTLVYAKYNNEDSLILWEDICQLSSHMEGPWLVGGDFNIVLNIEEKIGGLPIQDADHQDFDICIQNCDLFKIHFKGNPFTWWNKRVGNDCIF